MPLQENDFLEYLQLDNPDEPRLVTKSELLQEVRQLGQSISDRQLTFYVSEGLIPKSVRVGSRAGAYPGVIVDLLVWVLRAREQGLSVDAIKELVPIWKFVYRARKSRRLDLSELEYISRQLVRNFESVIMIPTVVVDMLSRMCSKCMQDLIVVTKDGHEHPLGSPETTIGFTAIRSSDKEEGGKPTWWGFQRVVIPAIPDMEDPTNVVIGIPPGEPVPTPPSTTHHDNAPDSQTDVVSTEEEVRAE